MMQMSFFQQVLLGVTSYADAHRLIFKHRLWGYIIAPGLINIAIFILSTVFIFSVSDSIINWFLSSTALLFGIEHFVTDNKGILAVILSVLLKIAFFLAYLSVYKYIVLILMSPLLALLSERVETIISGNEFPFVFSDFIGDVLRGILLAIRNLFLELLLLLLISVLSFFPVVNILCPLISFYISSYFYGFSMLDYSNERKRFTIKKSIHFIRMQRGVAFGNGAVFYFFLMIPFAGWLIAPAYSVTAAAIADRKIK